MRLNSSAINTLYDTPSWLIHFMALIVSIGYGVYHVRSGVLAIGLFAFGSTIFCTLTIIQIIRRNPKPLYYYAIFFCQFFALTLTSYYFGIRGLILVASFVSGAFFLFPFRAALTLSCVFVFSALAVSFHVIETTMYIRLVVAIMITVFFIITFSHVIDKQQRTLEREAHFDYLTDILNRRGFMSWLHDELPACQKQGAELVVYYIDLDKFKSINDNYGHDLGDELLVAFANRVLSILRSGELIKNNFQVSNFGRLSGDEFVLAITHIESRESARMIAERIENVVKRPFQFGTTIINVSISIGISFASDCDYDSNTILRSADMAMYESKKVEGCNYTIYGA